MRSAERFEAAYDALLTLSHNEPIVDRGHMVPNADMERSEAAMINTYMFSNMVPQHDRFNQQIWAHFENRVRQWTRRQGEVYVITGVVLDGDGDGVRDNDANADRVQPLDNVAIPTHYYKILTRDLPNERIDMLTILLDHGDMSPSGASARDQLLT